MKEAKGAAAGQSKEARTAHSGQDGPSPVAGLEVDGF